MKIRRAQASTAQPFPYRRFAAPRAMRPMTDELDGELWTPNDPSPSPEDDLRAEAFRDGERKGREEGFQQGFDQGFQQGAQETETQLTAAIEEQFNSLLAALKTAAEALPVEMERVERTLEAWIPRAALVIAETVLQRETQTDPDVVLAVVQDALAELPRGQQARVLLNPADYERLAEQPPEVWQSDALTFAPDESVTPGGAVIAGEEQIIDARLETRLLEAANHLLFPDTAADRSD